MILHNAGGKQTIGAQKGGIRSSEARACSRGKRRKRNSSPDTAAAVHIQLEAGIGTLCADTNSASVIDDLGLGDVAGLIERRQPRGGCSHGVRRRPGLW